MLINKALAINPNNLWLLQYKADFGLWNNQADEINEVDEVDEAITSRRFQDEDDEEDSVDDITQVRRGRI